MKPLSCHPTMLKTTEKKKKQQPFYIKRKRREKSTSSMVLPIFQLVPLEAGADLTFRPPGWKDRPPTTRH